MTTTIKLKLKNSRTRKVKAVVRGDLAIHMEKDVVASETKRHTYALTHVPSGLQIDGLYLRAMTLKAALRKLSELDWRGGAEDLRSNVGLKNAVIAEINRIESQCHWAHRRNLKPLEAAITQ